MPTIAFEASGNRPADGEEHQSGRLENADYTTRVAELVKIPAAVRFLSVEPLLGPTPSGPRYRAIQPERGRSIRDQCTAAGVAFFFKQWGGHTPKSGGRLLDGRAWDEMPLAGLLVDERGRRISRPLRWTVDAGLPEKLCRGIQFDGSPLMRSPCGRRH